MRSWILRLVVLAGALGAVPPGAQAQMDSREAIALQNQILELRRELQTLQAQGGRGGVAVPVPPAGSSYLGGNYGPRPLYPSTPPGGNDITAQLLARVQALEEQVRQLRGQLDEVTNQTQRQGAELSKQLGDLSFQLQQGGRVGAGAGPGPAFAPPAASPPPGNLGPGNLGTVPAPPSSPPAPTGAAAGGRRTPEIALQEGRAALGRRDYAVAEAAAREVLQGSRTSPRAYDAQLLLAQALSGQRNYAQAAIAYDDAYNRSRSGRHAPEALLGLANSLTAIGEKRAACETLNKLGAEFPRQGGEIRDAAASARQRAGCR